jgi:hypothetical protein
MFATSSGTPYGGYAIDNAPNASFGAGTQNIAGPGPPGMSDGYKPSVYNKSQDTVTNDTPSVLITPTRLPRLCSSHNEFAVADLVFVAISRYAPNGITYLDPRNRGSQNFYTTAMTIQAVNSELRQFARMAESNQSHWSADPEIVARWIAPIGSILNLQKAGQSTRSINVCVSRRALVRNTFTRHLNSRIGAFHCQSMDSVGVMYTVTNCKLTESGKDVKVVQLFTVVMPNYGDDDKYDMTTQLDINASNEERITINGNTRNTKNYISPVYRSLGRVLHSPPRCPNVAECQLGCVSRDAYYKLGSVEIQLGCP